MNFCWAFIIPETDGMHIPEKNKAVKQTLPLEKNKDKLMFSSVLMQFTWTMLDQSNGA